MENFYARAVFFVDDAERARRFYVEQLGFSPDWEARSEGKIDVCQVSLHGFELILNEVEEPTGARAGKGRVFIGLDTEQLQTFRKHLAAHGIRGKRVQWGRPTLLVNDVDGNELFFWPPSDDDWNLLES